MLSARCFQCSMEPALRNVRDTVCGGVCTFIVCAFSIAARHVSIGDRKDRARTAAVAASNDRVSPPPASVAGNTETAVTARAADAAKQQSGVY